MHQQRNWGGIAAVIGLHAAALLVILNNSTISILRHTPAVIEVFADPLPPPVEPPPVPLPASAPAVPAIAVPPLPDFVTAPATPTPLTTRAAADPAPPVTTAGPPAAGTGPVAAPRAPAVVPAVVDARACTRPDYPKSALRNGDTGTVTLAFLIGADGRVLESRIEQSSGHRELDRAAQAGLTLCRFQPGTVDGVPQQSWTRMQYVWTLDE